MRSLLIATTVVAGLSQGALAAAPSGADAEQFLIKTAADFATQYSAAPNEMAKGAIRAERAKALCAPSSPLRAVNGRPHDWIGTVAKLDSISDGRGILYVTIAPTVTLKTTNNSFGEAMGDTPTLIPAGSPLFAAAVRLSVGEKVRFSGNFYPSPDDCIRETSITTGGSMTEPDFLFRFTAVAPTE